MLMRPPYGDHPARPVSSYKMNRKFGAPSGAFFGVYGVQSGFDSRTSSLIAPLNVDPAAAPVGGACCCGAQAATPSALPTMRASVPAAVRFFTRLPPLLNDGPSPAHLPRRIDDHVSHRRSCKLRLI